MFMMIFYFSRVTDLTYAKSAPDMFNYIRATTGAYIYIYIYIYIYCYYLSLLHVATRI